MIGLVASGWQPIHVAAFTAASLIVLSGALTMQQAYRAIEWRAIFLVAAVLPVGLAMERTGAADLLAGSVTAAAPLGPHAILAALMVLASLLSQGLDGAPAVVLMAPVVLQTAENLGMSPYPLMMGVGLAASAAFMTPFSHKANLLVMGAGGYRFERLPQGRNAAHHPAACRARLPRPGVLPVLTLTASSDWRGSHRGDLEITGGRRARRPGSSGSPAARRGD